MRIFTVYLKTYSGCQLNCDHCMTNGKSGGNTVFDLEKTMNWFDRLNQYLPENTMIHVELFGGEPLLAPIESLETLLDHLEDLKQNRELSIGITTNLVYKLDERTLDFFKRLDGIGTSWDPDIRFDNRKQYLLWLENTKIINQLKIPTTLNISLSREVLKINPADLILWSSQLGFDDIAFERITTNGLATINDVIPSNTLINQWYLRLHEETQRRDLRDLIFNKTLEDVYAKFERNDPGCGTFCRDCETKMFTINANGSISGCPNASLTEIYGNIDLPMEELFNQPKRIQIMTKEAMRNEDCFQCSIFDICGSDCHQLSWNGRVCPAPKELMIKLRKGFKDE